MRIGFVDLVWLSGLLEGEGSFGVHSMGKRSRSPTIMLQLCMTDRDIVERTANLFGRQHLVGPYFHKDKPHHKPYYRTYVSATDAASICMTIYSFMGMRRKEQIRRMLGIWRNQPIVIKDRKASCHPSEPYYAKNSCKSCYEDKYSTLAAREVRHEEMMLRRVNLRGLVS